MTRTLTAAQWTSLDPVLNIAELCVESDTGRTKRANVGGQRWSQAAYLENFNEYGSGSLSGTGAPEGAVTATVGAEYVDNSATAGAVKWLKSSGSGNTGWKVMYGDTGWRTVLAWDAAGVFTTGTAFATPTAYAPRTSNAGWVRVRRIAGRAFVAFSNVQAGSAGIAAAAAPAMIALPAGFTATGTSASTQHPSTGGHIVSTNDVAFSPTGALAAGALIAGANPLTANWVADAAWPTALPGIAAT